MLKYFKKIIIKVSLSYLKLTNACFGQLLKCHESGCKSVFFFFMVKAME